MNLTHSLATLLTLSAIATTPLAGMSTSSISTSDNATASVSSTKTATSTVETISVTSTEKDEDCKNEEILKRWASPTFDSKNTDSIRLKDTSLVLSAMKKDAKYEKTVLKNLILFFQVNTLVYATNAKQRRTLRHWSPYILMDDSEFAADDLVLEHVNIFVALCRYSSEFALSLTNAICQKNNSLEDWILDLMVNQPLDTDTPTKYKNEQELKETYTQCLALAHRFKKTMQT